MGVEEWVEVEEGIEGINVDGEKIAFKIKINK